MSGTLSEAVSTTFTFGLLFGLYIVSLCYANRWLLFTNEGWKIKDNIHWTLVIATNLIGAILTANAGVKVESPMREAAFVQQGHLPSEYIRPPWEAIILCTLGNTVALLTDTLLIYRVWVTDGRKMWMTLFPVSLWVAGFVCMILQLFLQVAHIHNPNLGPFQWANVNMHVGPGIVLIPFWLSTIILNAYCTGILTRRIWRAYIEDQNSTDVMRQPQLLARILTESGVLYLAISLAYFIVWFGKSDYAILILEAMNVLVIGIAYNLITLCAARSAERSRVGGKESPHSGKSASDSSQPSNPSGKMPFDSKIVTGSPDGNQTSLETDQTVYRIQDSESSF